MKFMNLNEFKAVKTLAKFYPEKNFGGTPQEIGRGNFIASQLLRKPQSIKLSSDFATVVFYEKPDGEGKTAAFNMDCADLLSAIDFEPAAITVTLHAKGIKNGKTVGTIVYGIYETKTLSDYDEISVPADMYFAFFGNRADKHTMLYYTDETFAVPSQADYSNAAVMILGNLDAVLGLSETELSRDDLLSVVGGMQDTEASGAPTNCKIEGCGAKGCAIDEPCAAEASNQWRP